MAGMEGKDMDGSDTRRDDGNDTEGMDTGMDMVPPAEPDSSIDEGQFCGRV